MIEFIPKGPHRLDVKLSGKIDADDMRTGLDDYLEKAKDITDGVMLYTVENFEMPTFAALTVELGRLPKLFGLIGKFKKAALVADESWIRTIAEVEGALIPGLKIKGFVPEQAEAAEEWLNS
ncbi:MAG: STAS/SEC14 domain-containing protein [bacterium]